MLEVKGGYPFSSDFFHARAELRCLATTLVNDHKYCIIFATLGQVSDEVHGNALEWTCGRICVDWEYGGLLLASSDFVFLTSCASLYICFDELVNSFTLVSVFY